MNRIVRSYGLPLLIAVLLVGAGLGFYLYWRNPLQLQAVGVIASFAIAAALAGVTWQYAHATEQMLELLREQWRAQQQIYIRFGLMRQDGKARVWVRNLGSSRFMVTKAVITNGNSESKTLYMHQVVWPDRRFGFFIPDELWNRHTMFCDINVSLFYESATQTLTSQSRAYNLLISINHKQVIKISKGIKRWYAECPKCKRENKTFNRGLNTTGLLNFEEGVSVRRKPRPNLRPLVPNISHNGKRLWKRSENRIA